MSTILLLVPSVVILPRFGLVVGMVTSPICRKLSRVCSTNSWLPEIIIILFLQKSSLGLPLMKRFSMRFLMIGIVTFLFSTAFSMFPLLLRL